MRHTHQQLCLSAGKPAGGPPAKTGTAKDGGGFEQQPQQQGEAAERIVFQDNPGLNPIVGRHGLLQLETPEITQLSAAKPNLKAGTSENLQTLSSAFKAAHEMRKKRATLTEEEKILSACANRFDISRPRTQ
eukprot:GHVU01004522.1.p2 GENE.GHVU01004522.1~~GHVU01004522.1.p2  ORF type:complete len:132 (-),score=31.27 GHVU01004522.1:142-537(-)